MEINKMNNNPMGKGDGCSDGKFNATFGKLAKWDLAAELGINAEDLNDLEWKSVYSIAGIENEQWGEAQVKNVETQALVKLSQNCWKSVCDFVKDCLDKKGIECNCDKWITDNTGVENDLTHLEPEEICDKPELKPIKPLSTIYITQKIKDDDGLIKSTIKYSENGIKLQETLNKVQMVEDPKTGNLLKICKPDSNIEYLENNSKRVTDYHDDGSYTVTVLNKEGGTNSVEKYDRFNQWVSTKYFRHFIGDEVSVYEEHEFDATGKNVYYQYSEDENNQWKRPDNPTKVISKGGATTDKNYHYEDLGKASPAETNKYIKSRQVNTRYTIDNPPNVYNFVETTKKLDSEGNVVSYAVRQHRSVNKQCAVEPDYTAYYDKNDNKYADTVISYKYIGQCKYTIYTTTCYDNEGNVTKIIEDTKGIRNSSEEKIFENGNLKYIKRQDNYGVYSWYMPDGETPYNGDYLAMQ